MSTLQHNPLASPPSPRGMIEERNADEPRRMIRWIRFQTRYGAGIDLESTGHFHWLIWMAMTLQPKQGISSRAAIAGVARTPTQSDLRSVLRKRAKSGEMLRNECNG